MTENTQAYPKKRILIADDEEEWRNAAAAAVTGHEVAFAQSGREALAILEDAGDETHNFDLLILDNKMESRNDGARLLHFLRNVGDRVPIIIHSSDLPHMTAEQVKKDLGVYVQKSYSGPAKLKAAVDELLAKL